MKHLFTVGKAYLSEKLGWGDKRLSAAMTGNGKYAGKTIMSGDEAQTRIRELIASGEPCCIGRFGSNELFSMSVFEFDITCKQEKAISQLHECAGFFPNDTNYGRQFNECMREACAQMDILGVWAPRFEEYYIRKYASKSIKLTHLYDLEPWKHPQNPWSDVLAGKKVLIIHPWAETIRAQYAKREKLFENTGVLPAYELKTLKAVQTIAGEKDDRFETWFEALEWMYQEALKIDFDIAIIGCGAYGFPLAAKLKKAGKQAFHLGGATQLMFGIKGKRWVEYKTFAYVQSLFIEAWIYPSENDKPRNLKKVEDGCYW